MTALARIARRLAPWMTALLLAGCATLPDAGNLADASIQLRSAVAATGAAVAAELRTSESRERASRADAFLQAWAPTEAACAALARYAESLAMIVKAGEEGGESARKVAAAGVQLASALPVNLPAAGALTAGTNLAAFLYQQVTRAQASRSLEESLQRMQPAVDEIAAAVGAQLGAAGDILQAANTQAVIGLRVQAADDRKYLEQLAQERKKFYVVPATGTSVQEMERIDRAERIVRASLDPRLHEIEAAAQRLRQSMQLISAARLAVADWADAHGQLLVAVREKRALDPQALLQSIGELRDLVRKVREAS